jgi:hypothetical protein
MVHDTEAGDPDNPNGYRSISDRGLIVSDTMNGSIGRGTLLGLTRIPYTVVRTDHTLDIVQLGDRNTVDNGNWMFDAVPDGDNIGIQPDWLPVSDQTGPQTSDVSGVNAVMGAQTRIGVLYQISNGGGFFNMTLGFDDMSQVVVQLEGPDWFFDQAPNDPGNGVEAQAELGVFLGSELNDFARTGASLNVVEAIVSTQSLLNGGFGDITGRRLTSITFSDRTSLTADYAIIAASVRDPSITCPCDWNHANGVNSQDFFDFLNDFFAGNADFNHMDGTNSQDFFDFLNCFFMPPAGC